MSELAFIPSEVAQAVAQHHERIDGSGFPAHLSDAKISPLAKLIAVADSFCDLYLNHKDQSTAEAALARLTMLYSNCLARDFLIGLYRAFHISLPETLFSSKPKVADVG